MLEELRKKPKAIRNLYAFWGAVILTGIIALVWVLSLFAKFDKIETPSFKETNETTGAFSQFIEKTKQRFLNDESEADQSSVFEETAATTTSSETASSTESTVTTQFQISTTTEQKVQIGTSSAVAD